MVRVQNTNAIIWIETAKIWNVLIHNKPNLPSFLAELNLNCPKELTFGTGIGGKQLKMYTCMDLRTLNDLFSFRLKTFEATFVVGQEDFKILIIIRWLTVPSFRRCYIILYCCAVLSSVGNR